MKPFSKGERPGDRADRSGPTVHAPGEGEVRLSRQLLELHRAMTLPELWKAVRHLLVSSFECHSVSLYLNYFDDGERFHVLHHQNAPGAPLPWRQRRQVSPAHAFLSHHPGQKIFDTRDLLPGSRPVERTGYFRNVMSVEGWSSHLCLAFWDGGEPRAIIVIRRTSMQGEFSPGDHRLVESLYDHFAVALGRIERMQDEQIVRSCLTHRLSLNPSGLLILDRHFQPILKNQAAMEACLTWNHGSESRYDASKCFAVPQPLAETCRGLHRDISVAQLDHPAGGSVCVERMHPNHYRLGRPYYLVAFSPPPTAAPSGGHAEAPGFVLLTTREREVALAAADGLSNAEIAARFGKSEITIKSQLSSVFTKLGVQRRSQLAALKHRPAIC